MRFLILTAVFFGLFAQIGSTQTSPATTGTTGINSAQAKFAVKTSTLNVQELNLTVGPIATGLNMTLPNTGCSYMQVFLNGLKQTSGVNMDFTIAGGVIVFNNSTVKQGDLVSLVCFN